MHLFGLTNYIFCAMKTIFNFFSQVQHDLSLSYLHVSDSASQGLWPGAQYFDHPFMPINSTKKHPRTRKECEECSFVVPKLTHHDETNIYKQIFVSPIPAPFFEPCARYLFNAKATQSLHQRNLKKKIPYSRQTSKIPPSWFVFEQLATRSYDQFCQVSLQFWPP